SQRESLMSEAAVFQARRRNRSDIAAHWVLDMKSAQTPWLQTKALVGILEAQGDIEGALKKLDEFEKAILPVSDTMLRKTNETLLARWRSELIARRINSCGPGTTVRDKGAVPHYNLQRLDGED